MINLNGIVDGNENEYHIPLRPGYLSAEDLARVVIHVQEAIRANPLFPLVPDFNAKVPEPWEHNLEERVDADPVLSQHEWTWDKLKDMAVVDALLDYFCQAGGDSPSEAITEFSEGDMVKWGPNRDEWGVVKFYDDKLACYGVQHKDALDKPEFVGVMLAASQLKLR